MAHIHELYDFTVSAYIIHPTEPKLCLHFHKKLNFWLQPGGHIELDEDPMQALTHELKEEVGLDPNQYEIIHQSDQPKPSDTTVLPLPMHFFWHNYDEKHRHIDLTYLVKSKTADLKPQKDESQQIDWFTIKDIRELDKKGQIPENAMTISEWIANKYF